MDYEQRVRRASGGDVKAFVDLTRQFQNFAFGTALAVANDFHQAEDIVQEAFVAAWPRCRALPIRRRFPAGCAASCGIRRSGCCEKGRCEPCRSRKPRIFRARTRRPTAS
jgi:hypothetical protein